MTEYRVVDLFAGCGGLSLGFTSAKDTGVGFVHAGAVELDIDAAATYSTNVDDKVFCGDIAEWLEQEELPLDVDVILGGPPCQGFSALGKQEGRDVRNAMWRRYAEAVCRMQPRFFVLENVREFLQSSQFRALRSECRPKGMLPDYRIESFVLDSSAYGSPQKRKRAIVVGRRIGQDPLGEPPQCDQRSTVADAFAGLRAEVLLRDLPGRSLEFAGTVVKGPFTGSELHITRNFTALSLQRYKSIPTGGNRFDIPDELLSDCWRRHKSGSGDVMGRLVWDRPSVTVRTEFFKPEKGRYLHPAEDRPITHLEAARLQGFPDDFKWFGSKSSIARQIGNAVPIPLGVALGHHILSALKTQDQSTIESSPHVSVIACKR